MVCSAVRFKTFASRDEYIFDLGKNIFVLRNKYSFLCMSGDTIGGAYPFSFEKWGFRGGGGDNVKGVEGPTQRTSTSTESLSEKKKIGVACFFRKI